MAVAAPGALGASGSGPLLRRLLQALALVAAALLAACGSSSLRYPAPMSDASAPAGPQARPATGEVPGTLQQARSRWVPVDWSELPGLEQDPLYDAWSAWIRSCEKLAATQAALCSEVRRLSIATPEDQRAWMRRRLQPYRVEAAPGDATGLLTGYFEPQLSASRQPQGAYTVPIYLPPPTLAQRKPWYTRQEIDTLPQAQAELRGRALAYLADPIDALILQIQGSGRLAVTQPDGSVRTIRVAFAGTNDQPYRSVGRWLLDQGLVRDASWPGIKAWLAQNPQRQQELLWSNPRMVFFKEEPLSDLDAAFGPRGAQGVPLTPGRSIAVDPQSVPYGTAVWLASSGTQVQINKLVLAQDTGSAITGAVRADYFVGWGAEAADLAGRLRQPLQMWVLWPK